MELTNKHHAGLWDIKEILKESEEVEPDGVNE